MTFGGVRFRDFLEAYPPNRNPDGSLPRYAAMTTPDGSYYCGFEIEALLHPQTLLCFRMSRKELTPDHGAPLRLAMPIKYGYKQIKQIARITYTNQKTRRLLGQPGLRLARRPLSHLSCCRTSPHKRSLSTSTPTQGAPHLASEMWAGDALTSTPTQGAPHLASEMWAGDALTSTQHPTSNKPSLR